MEVCFDLSLFELANAGPARPNSREEKERFVFTNSELGIWRALSFQFLCWIWLCKLCGGHNATAFRTEPAPPMRGQCIAHIVTKLGRERLAVVANWLLANLGNKAHLA
jgi:hypothetical protein